MLTPIVALLDANVLYPAPLRDFLLRLADAEFFRPCWSEEIHEEWMRNLSANRPDLTHTQIARTRALMDTAFPEAQIAGYEHLIPALTNHPKDRHVLAAAIQGQAHYIVTFNTKDFPKSALTPHGIQLISPDALALGFYKTAPHDVVSIIRNHRAKLTRPPKTAQEYLDTLAQCRLPQTVALLQNHLNDL